MAIRLIIQGLRRSGTTIFWQCFRQDPRLRCFDEPFNPNLHVLPGRQGLKHPEEFVELHERDALKFWETFTPIHFTDELRPGFSDRHAAWLRFIGDSADTVALDTTRCQFKCEALAELAPQAVLVHLWRPPESLATSHLLPSGGGAFERPRRGLQRRSFFTRATDYNHWNFEAIIGASPGTLFARRLEQIGLDPALVYGLPAVGRLLAYWRVCFERVERDGPRCFGPRFVSLRFDDFCERPAEALGRVYAALGLAPPSFDLSRVHAANGPYRPDHPDWARYRRLLGLPDEPGGP